MGLETFEKISYRNDLSKYEINRLGQIRQVATKRMIKGYVDNYGYIKWCLTLDSGNTINQLAHIAVAKQFIPNPENKPIVNHIDEDKTNCRADNLEWVTAKENTRHGNAIAKSVEMRSRAVNQYDLNGRYIRTWKDVTSIIEAYSGQYGRRTIEQCCQNKTVASRGYIFRWFDGSIDNINVYVSEKVWQTQKPIVEPISIPDDYLLKMPSCEEICKYFLESAKLTAYEKLMIKELASV